MHALNTPIQAAHRHSDCHHDLHCRTRYPGSTAGADRYLAVLESICDQAIREGRSYLELITMINRRDAARRQ